MTELKPCPFCGAAGEYADVNKEDSFFIVCRDCATNGPPADYYATASSRQVGGDHYIKIGIQPWEAMKSWMGKHAFRGFLWGNIIKYVSRWELKGGVEDLRKARHYLDKLIEELEGAQ